MRQFFTVVEGTGESSRDLATLEDVKLELGITGEDQDEQLQAHITRISGAFADYCDRLFSLEDVIEVFVFDYGETFLARQPLLLRQYPIVDIESVTINGMFIDDYEYDQASGRLWRTQAAWGGRVEVQYTGGFDLPGGAPAGLQWALIEALRQRRAFALADPTVRQTSHGDTSVSFYSEPMVGAAGFSRSVVDALNQFKRISV